MIRGRFDCNQPASISRVETHLGEVQEVDHASRTHRFFVYCKKPCRSLQPGKLRVRCAECKDQAFELFRVSCLFMFMSRNDCFVRIHKVGMMFCINKGYVESVTK